MTKGNVNYRRGRAKEYRLKYKLQKEGYDIVQRLAGSHSPIDVIGIKKGKIKFIQSKHKKFSKKKAEELKKKYKWLNSTFVGEFEVR